MFDQVRGDSPRVPWGISAAVRDQQFPSFRADARHFNDVLTFANDLANRSAAHDLAIKGQASSWL